RNGSGALTSSWPKDELSPTYPSISAASVVILLVIYFICSWLGAGRPQLRAPGEIFFGFLVNLPSLSPGTSGRSSEKSLKILQKLQKRLIQWLAVARLRLPHSPWTGQIKGR